MSRILLTERGTRRVRPRRVATAAAAFVMLLLLTGCAQETTDEFQRLGLPEGVTDKTPYVLDLWIGAWIAAGIVGVFTWGLIGWAAIRYRRRSDDDLPVQVRYHLPIEILYTVAPIFVVAVFFFFTLQAQEKLFADEEDPTHTVEVTAQQWAWTFSYIGEPAVDGSDVYEVGTPALEPELWLVKGETATIEIESPDVVHSFWIPAFYFKLDILPGPSGSAVQSFSITPTKAGKFEGRCAEFCGWLHSRMLFTVVVVETREEFDAHVQELQEAGQTGSPPGGENASVVAGLDDAEASE